MDATTNDTVMVKAEKLDKTPKLDKQKDRIDRAVESAKARDAIGVSLLALVSARDACTRLTNGGTIDALRSAWERVTELGETHKVFMGDRWGSTAPEGLAGQTPADVTRLILGSATTRTATARALKVQYTPSR